MPNHKLLRHRTHRSNMNIRRDHRISFDVRPLVLVVVYEKLLENVRDIVAQLVGLLELQPLVDKLSVGVRSVPTDVIGQFVLAERAAVLPGFLTFRHLPARRRSVVGHPRRYVRMETAEILDRHTIGHVASERISCPMESRFEVVNGF